MSEVGIYRTRLNIVIDIDQTFGSIEQNPLFQMLQRAMEIVAEKYNAEIVQKVKDRFGRETVCDIALRTPDFPLGVGIQVNKKSGAVEFIHDLTGSSSEVVQQIRAEIVQTYTALAVIKAMKSLGYEVMEEPRKENVIALVGVLR